MPLGVLEKVGEIDSGMASLWLANSAEPPNSGSSISGLTTCCVLLSWQP